MLVRSLFLRLKEATHAIGQFDILVSNILSPSFMLESSISVFRCSNTLASLLLYSEKLFEALDSFTSVPSNRILSSLVLNLSVPPSSEPPAAPSSPISGAKPGRDPKCVAMNVNIRIPEVFFYHCAVIQIYKLSC